MVKVAIGEMCEVIKGGIGIKKAIPGKYPLVTTGTKQLSHQDYQFDCEAVCVPLVSSTGHGHACMHRVYYQDGKFALGSILAAIMPKNPNVVIARFLYIYLSLMKDKILVPLMKGTANVSLSVKAIKSAKIILPSIEKQRKVVEVYNKVRPLLITLENAFSSQEDWIKKLRNSILQEAVQGRLVPQDPEDEPASKLLAKIKAEKHRLIKEGKIRKQKLLPPIKLDEVPYDLPQAWQWTPLGELLNLEYGKGLPKDKRSNSGNVPVYGANGIMRYYSDPLIRGRSIIVGRKGSAGALNISNEPCWPTDVTYYVQPSPLLYFEFIFYLMKSLNLEGMAKGIKPGLNRNEVYNLVVGIPSFNEQKRIVAKVNELMTLCDELEEKLNQAKTDSDKLTSAVVHHFLTSPFQRVRATTPYKNDAAVICLLLQEMEKLQRPTTEFFIQKHIFVTKHHLHLPVNSLFVRKVAGPWSHELKRKAIFAAVKMDWLRWDKQGNLVCGPSFNKGLNHAVIVLGESAAQLVQLVKDLKAFGPNGLERWTTVLKVVEDLKETQQPITRANIQHEINTWPDKSLKEIFTEKSINHTIKMMLKHRWLPTSAGQ
ncbi:MAG: restriction endonuclease subunit S [Planctomycetota bacterium]